MALSLLAIIVYTLIRYKSSTVDNTITIDSHAYPFEIKELPGRGKGLIATRDIEVVTIETPSPPFHNLC